MALILTLSIQLLLVYHRQLSNQRSFHTEGKSIPAYNLQTNSAISKWACALISAAVIWIILACNTLIA